MNYYADLHIHSYYSRATSKQLNLEHLTKWGQIKGLNIIATGDITHPKWLAEMRDKLVESEQGLYTLKDDYRNPLQNDVPGACASDVHFILSGEISTIYKRHDKVRKVHSVVFMPSLQAVEKFQATLDRIGNIHSDGRPILGLDTRDLLEIVLETDDNAQFIPAHIWTPWFSIFGSKSGFDSLEECFDDLTPHIFALETGLSSDPPMNWRLSMLDPYVLVSNSDAHSPAKLAREANLFQTDLSYDALFHALKDRNSDAFWGTIEFFPQEGKYHMDGHRKCNSRTRPADTMANNGLCPVCGKPSVLGVSYRVEELADRDDGYRPPHAKPFKSLIPLPEVLSEVVGVGPNSKRVQQLYFHVLAELGSELDILTQIEIHDIQSAAGALTAEAIRRMRKGDIHPIPGYDGEYGIIKVFKDGERDKLMQQDTLFALPEIKKVEKTAPAPQPPKAVAADKMRDVKIDYGLNAAQRQAVEHRGSPLIIKAGPGTGKTRTLTQRLASLIKSGDAKPVEILAITFSTKAAAEMRERIEKLVGSDSAPLMTIQTFHAFGAAFLREQEYFFDRDWDFRIVSIRDDAALLNELKHRIGDKVSVSLLERVSYLKALGHTPESIPKEILETSPQIMRSFFEQYEQLLVDENGIDFDDLINLTVRRLSQNPDIRRDIVKKYPIIAVDEFQDINKMQYELFRLLAIPARDVCVIGDPDQAIYGFRGASAQYFHQFTQDVPHATFIQLVQNYRSAQNIVAASLQMLRRRDRQEKLWSNLDPEVKVVINVSPTDRAEAEFVVHRIEQHVGGTTFFSLDSRRVDDHGLTPDFSFADFAILLRSRRLAPPLIEALTRSGIPFQHIDDSTVMTQPFLNLVNAALTAKLRENADVIAAPAAAYFDDKNVSLFLTEFHALPDDSDMPSILQWLDKFIQDDADDHRRILKNLADRAASFSNSDHFLDTLMLQRQIDNFDPRADRVHLLTMHAAKGLEFPVVFIIGCEDGVIPHYIPGQKLDADEERRLLYVGMTRAQRLLYLTRARQRMIFGQKRTQEPSRFLSRISESVLQHDQQKFKSSTKNNQLSLF